jgi:hypothetical protein
METLRQSAFNPASQNGAPVRTQSKEETAGNLHAHSNVKNANPETASGEVDTVTSTAANIAMVQSVSAAIPAPVDEVRLENHTEASTQTSLTDLSSQLLPALTPDSIQSASSLADRPGSANKGTITPRNQAAGTFDGAEAVDSPHVDRSGVAARETSAAANQATNTVVKAEGMQSSHTQVPFVPAALTVASGSHAEEGTTAAPAVQVKNSTVPARVQQAAMHGKTGASTAVETQSPSSTGLAAPTAGEEPTSSGRMRPQSENTDHTYTDSQPRLQTQPAIQGVEAIATPAGSGAMEQGSAIGNAAASPSVPAPDRTPIVGKAGPASGSKTTSVQASLRSSQTAAAVRGDRQGQAAQAVEDGANSAAPASDSTTARTAVNLGVDSAGAASKDGSASRDTFAALDAESSSGTATWLHAGTRRAEAGFQDPELGWVGVRADASGGGVHASLVPGSVEAAVTLGGHLAGLNAYLSEQHTPVDSLTLAATEERSANTGMGQSAQQSQHQGAGQDTGQGASSGQQSSPQESSPVTAAAIREISADFDRTETTAQAFNSGGTHISVMA